MNGPIMFNPQEDIEKLLINNVLDKLVRHYKIIKKNFDDEINLNQNPGTPDNYNYDNICQIGVYDFNTNEFTILLDRFGYQHPNNKWGSITELQNYIKEKEIELWGKYRVELTNSINQYFTEDEYNTLYRVINQYNNSNKDNLYIRLAPPQSERQNLICRYLEFYDKNFYDDLIAHGRINEYIKDEYMPTYNVDYIYSESKYNTVTNKKVNEIFNNLNINKKIEEL